jgi:hypothetical protein
MQNIVRARQMSMSRVRLPKEPRPRNPRSPKAWRTLIEGILTSSQRWSEGALVMTRRAIVRNGATSCIRLEINATGFGERGSRPMVDVAVRLSRVDGAEAIPLSNGAVEAIRAEVLGRGFEIDEGGPWEVRFEKLVRASRRTARECEHVFDFVAGVIARETFPAL